MQDLDPYKLDEERQHFTYESERSSMFSENINEKRKNPIAKAQNKNYSGVKRGLVDSSFSKGLGPGAI